MFGIYDNYIFATIAMLGTILGSCLVVWLAHYSSLAVFFHRYGGIQATFLGVIGTLFALTLAFLANDTWVAHDRALNIVYQEADALRSLEKLSEHLPIAVRKTVVDTVQDYAKVTVEQEWPMLARRQTSHEASYQLDKLLILLSEPGMDIQPTVLSHMLDRVIQVRTARGMRIALSQTHINPLKWSGMAFLGFLSMISIVMVNVEKRRAGIMAVIIFAAAAGPMATIVLIQANPFQHPTSVDSRPIGELVKDVFHD